ncbi:MAG: hypothetical protein LH606_12410 [Cytophagaceae bacterium]|nr:hypothetical protein [Cytophagaceae bacterium]
MVQVVYQNPDEFWTIQTEIAAPVVFALSKADEQTKARIKTEVYDLAKQKMSGDHVSFNYGSWIVWGTKR